MSEVKWIKIVTDIFDDEKILLIESMPEGDAIIVIWFKLLCLAGKQNNGGVFQINGRIPYTDEMFATIFRRNVNTVRLALSTFEKFDMIEIINNTVTIPKWERHQKLDALEASRAASRNRVARFRERQKLLIEGGNVSCNVTETDGVTPGNADRYKNKNKNNISSADAEIPQGFSDFWAVYPRKVSKQTALKAWRKLGVDDSMAIADTIIADVQRRVTGEWKGKDVQYIPHPATYLNQRRWEDEVTAPADDYRPTIQEILNQKLRENGGDCIVPGFDKPFGVD